MRNVYVGVDIGGTNTMIGLFDESIGLLAKTSMATTKPHFPGITNNPKAFLNDLAQEIRGLVLNNASNTRLTRVGMGVPGIVDPVKGIALGAANLGWVNVPVAAEMALRLGCEVRVDNDVRIYVLGEAKEGAAKGYRNVICLTLGTGLAVGILIDGRLVRGSDWCAGEIGHDTVYGQDAPCSCGKRGCLETIASATGIARLATEVVIGGANTVMQTLTRKITALDVYQAAVGGDPAAIAIFRFVGTVLAEKLTTAVYLLNPEAIIVGGGVSAAGEVLLGPIRETIYGQYLMNRKPLIAAGTLGDSAGLFGAVHFVLNYDKWVIRR